ncbi:flagellar basal body-associated FliL family protein [bacterium]|nr:flagellar basal body-associated FliL family protein [bacterium]
MAEEEKEEGKKEEKDSGNKKPSILKNPLLLIGILLVAQIGIAFLMVNVMSNKADEKKTEIKEAKLYENKRGKIIQIEDILVNLKENNKLHYLKLTIGLEIGNSGMEEEIKARESSLKDIVISRITGKRVSDFDSDEEINALKKDLNDRLSKALQSGKLLHLYFSDFIIQ